MARVIAKTVFNVLCDRRYCRNIRRAHLLLPLLAGSLLSFFQAAAFAATVPPLEVEVISSINAQTAKVGDDVLLKVDKNWTDGQCSLAQAAVLHATVLEAGTIAGSKREQLALQPLYPCTEPVAKPLFVFAILAQEDDGTSLELREFRSASFGEGGGLGSTGSTQANHVDLSGRQNPSIPISVGRDESQVTKRPTSLHAGEVWKLNKVKLKLDAGPDHASVVESTSGHLRLLKGTMLVLTEEEPREHELGLPPEAAAIAPGPVHAPKLTATSIPPLARCRPPSCASLPSDASKMQAAQPALTIALHGLNYNRLKQAEMLEPGFDSAVAFVGNDHVLFTYNSHALVHRLTGTRAEERPHAVHAVLISLQTGNNEEAARWEIPDHRQYLWQLPRGRVLVHNGDRLQMIGPGFTVERTLPLSQALAYVRIAPDGNHIAVASVAENHSPEEHQRVFEVTGTLPEERVQVALYDAAFNKLDEVAESSRSVPPVLMNEGWAQLRMLHDGDFYIRFQEFARRSHRDFARIKSECIPIVKSFSGDLLVAETCNTRRLSNDVTVFRKDGSPVFDSTVDWRGLSPLITGTSEQTVFALAAIQIGGDYVRGSVFHAQDMLSEAVSLKDVQTGREVLHIAVGLPSPDSQAFALSPMGERLAVLDGENLKIFAVPQ